MTPTAIRDHLRKEPFQPIAVHLSDGASYEIRHPENAAISVAELAIAIGGNDEQVATQMVYCDPQHVTRIEPLPRTPTRKA